VVPAAATQRGCSAAVAAGIRSIAGLEGEQSSPQLGDLILSTSLAAGNIPAAKGNFIYCRQLASREGGQLALLSRGGTLGIWSQ